jgi:hypothetical protein
MEAAGVETSKCVFSNWLMAHEFWSNSLNQSLLPLPSNSTPLIRSCHESTTVLETFWRRASAFSSMKTTRLI